MSVLLNRHRSLIATATLPAVAALAILQFAGGRAAAETLTYDADLALAGPQDGAGAGWNVAANPANWVNGSNSNVQWSTANTTDDTAIFGNGSGGTGGTVTVGTVNVGTIQLNPTVTTGYTLSGGTITLGTGITSTATLTSVINSVISGGNGLAFTGTGTATVTLGGANQYTGVTTLSTAGRLNLTNAASFGASTGATATTLGTDYTQVNAGSTAVLATSTPEAFLINGTGTPSAGVFPGALRINNTPTLSGLIRLGSNALILNNGGNAAIISGNIDVGTFTVTLNTFGNTLATTVSGNITGTGAGGVSLSSSGGPILLNGTNTYTGTTSVGSATANSGFLGGTGSLQSSTVTVNAGGTITGGSNGTTGTLTLANNATINGKYLADLTAAASDTLAIGGTLNLNSATDVLTIQGTTGLASYTLATFTTLLGTFDTVVGLPAGYTLNYNANSITLAVPEPGAAAVVSVLAAALLKRRRSV